MQLSKLAEVLSAQVSSDATFSGVTIDSRSLEPRQLFVAIKGENFDGHDFMLDAEKKGAAAIICTKSNSQIKIPQIVVADTILALAKIAKYHRLQMPCKVIALTGSNGKTTVKEMIASILPQPSFATKGNFNNHIGVPLSALQLTTQDKFAVFELGANHIGEISYNVDIVQPDVSLINNIGPAHIEGFGSIEGVARAKGEIYQGLQKDGTAIVNADDKFSHFWDDSFTGKKVVRFSRESPADVFAKDIEFNENGKVSFNLVANNVETLINLNVPGIHNVSNALAAASCALAVGISASAIKQGLEAFGGVAGRMTYIKGLNEALIIDDTYNANLRSVTTAIDVLAARSGFKVLVMGDMGELGDYTQLHHQEVGEAAKAKGIDLVLTLGEHSRVTAESFGDSGKHYAEEEPLVQDLLPYLNTKTTVLVKGSRAAAMEKIVKKLEEN